jgi:23S rRNA (guanine2445-N2)-methyltransferase / 23S rRNA (guanine2069-N7)-methyltransferase
MQQTLDIQRDHQDLIGLAMKLLARDGLLLFSTNRRSFKLADSIQQSYNAVDVTRSTIAEDFKRNPKIHRCWEIRHRV